MATNFVPETFLVDYEYASVQAISEVSGNGLVVEGCWFHFSNSVTKCVKTI